MKWNYETRYVNQQYLIKLKPYKVQFHVLCKENEKELNFKSRYNSTKEKVYYLI